MAPTNYAERRKAGSGINAFAAQKGVARSIQNFKYRKEVRKGKKSALLRQYQKVMVKEGYGKNTSRKGTRRKDDDGGRKDDDEEGEKQRRGKQNPFAKSLKKAEQARQHKVTERAQQEDNKRKQEQRQRQRQKQSKLLSKRTSKGQPVMRHMISGLLEKIEEKHL